MAAKTVPKPASEPDGPAWENRIKSFDPAVDPADLVAHPANPRLHPDDQRAALNESLDRVGWVDVVKVNTASGRIVDGHARVEEAIAKGVTVPVMWLELTEEEEHYVLASLDPIGALATYDAAASRDLFAAYTADDSAVASMLRLLNTPIPELPPDGDRGNTKVGDEQNDRRAAAEERAGGELGLRSVIFVYDLDNHAEVSAQLSVCREQMSVETNAEVLRILLDGYLNAD